MSMWGEREIEGARKFKRLWAPLLLCVTAGACQPMAQSFAGKGLMGWASSVPVLESSVGSGDDAWPSAESVFEAEEHSSPRDGDTSGTSRADYVLLGVDCFGAVEKDCQALARIAGLKRGQTLPMGWTGGDAVNRIQLSGPYVFVAMSPVFYPDGSVFIAIDLVTRQQRDRLALRREPSSELELTSNLFVVYEKFTGAWMRLFSKGIEVRSQMQSGHWGYEHRDLLPYVRLFRSAAPAQRPELMRVLLHDADPGRRTAAAAILGYDEPNQDVDRALELALVDPVPSVRSAAARALLPRVRLAREKDAAIIDPAMVIRMLSLPSTSDRSGASALLAELAKVPKLRRPILDGAFELLLQMVAASSPGSRGASIEVLEAATGLSFGSDVSRWRRLKI